MRINPILYDLSDNFPLNSNPAFRFLRIEAEKLEGASGLSPTVHRAKLQKLSLLLNEIILTTDHKLQKDLLSKVSAWYTSHSPRAENSCFNPKLSSNNTIFSTPQPRISSINNTQVYRNTPEPTRSKDPHLCNMSYLTNIKKLNEKYFNWENARAKLNSNLVFRRSAKRPFTKKVKVELGLSKPQSPMPVVDFRPFHLTETRDLETSQRIRSEHAIIEDIKRRLANKRLVVSSKNLENGISLYTEKQTLNSTQLLPFGGELLMKTPKTPPARPNKSCRLTKRL